MLRSRVCTLTRRKLIIGGNADMPETGEVRQLFMGTAVCTAMLTHPN
jgi:hypothetical protein